MIFLNGGESPTPAFTLIVPYLGIKSKEKKSRNFLKF